jgi:protein-disulfide isomerase
VSLEGAELRGDSRAPVVIIEWSDYQCPYCGRAERDVLPTVDQNYIKTGKAQLAFRHLPLKQLHPRAEPAAQAALCAGDQGRFWDMHAALFGDQANLDDHSLLARAHRLSLDEAKFASCASGGEDPRISRDIEVANTLRLTSTPTFLIGLRQPDGKVSISGVLPGARSATDFATLIDALITGQQTNRSNRAIPWLPVSGALTAFALAAGILKARRRRAVVQSEVLPRS